MALLAGDIGGTKAWLALYQNDSEQPLFERVYPSQQFDSLAAIIHQFMLDSGVKQLAAASFGLPGPVSNNQAQLTNLPWQVCAAQLQQQLAIPVVQFINDFQAAAMGIDAIAQQDLLCLQPGQPIANANRLVVGAGTGLGVAPVVRYGCGFLPQASEGGHMDFAPVSEVQQRILSWLWQAWPHVSYERLLSGAGLQYLYAFFAGLELGELENWPQPEQVQQLAESGDGHAVAALENFVQIYGAYVGNLAMLWPARAGIYIAGGIAAKVEPWLSCGKFVSSMHDKGRMQELVQQMPVYLVRDPALGLKGAMLCARKILSRTQPEL